MALPHHTEQDDRGAEQDIGERRLALALAENAVLFDEAPLAYLRLDGDGLVRRVNRRTERLLGRPAASLVGRPVSSWVHPRDASWLGDLLDSGTPATITLPGLDLRLQSGRGILRAELLSVRRDPGGGWLLALGDPTRRHETEAILEDREARLAAILETVADGILVLGSGGRVRSLNGNAVELFGYSPLEMIGQTVDHVLPGGWPRGDSAVLSRFEGFARHRDGRHFPVEAAARRLKDGHGQVVLLVRDISERVERDSALRESLRRFQQIAEQSADAFYIAEIPRGRYLYATPAFELIFGRPLPLDVEPGDPPWLPWVHEEDRQRVSELHARVRGGEPGGELRYRVQRPDGSLRTLQDRTFGPREGDKARMTGTLQDVTDAERLAGELRRAHRLEAIGNLSSGIAHDFNNLLMGISGAVELALEALQPGQLAHRALQRALESTRRGAKLTRQLLNFDGSRRPGASGSTVELDRVLEGLTEMAALLLGEHIQLDAAFGAAGQHVAGETSEIEQVLLNLATNARDAMPGGGTLRLATRGETDAGGARQICLAVQDSGDGMDARTLEHIFDPFFTTKPHGKGSGLGLASVMAVVRRLGGQIDVQSQPGQGTTFEIRLPVVDPPERPVSARQGELPWAEGTVLLVEDDALVRTAVHRQLERLGYRVVQAVSPDGAVAAWREHAGPVDVLLTDVMMPGRLGTEVAAEMRRLLPGLRVVFMSGQSQEAHARAGRVLDGDGFLAKPFDPATLARAISEVLQRPAPSRTARTSRASRPPG